MMKKLICWIVLASLCISLSACARKQDEVTRLPSILAPEPAGNGAEDLPGQEPAETLSAEDEKITEAPPAESKPESPEQEDGLDAEPDDTPDEDTLLEETELLSASIDLEGLRTALEEELNTCTGSWALYWKCLDTGETISINNGSMVAASLIKLFVAGAWYDAVERGQVENAPELVRTMISDSSNDACNQLIDKLGNGDAAQGMEIVNRFAGDLGCHDTQINRKMLESSPSENYTSVEDCGNVLEKIYSGGFVSQEDSAALLDYMKAQIRTSKIPAGVPNGTMTANKTGELADVENDAAIVWSPNCTYILCVMSDDILSPGAGQGNIAGLSKIVYEYLNGAA